MRKYGKTVSILCALVISLSAYAGKIRIGLFAGGDGTPSSVKAYASRMFALLKGNEQFEIKYFSNLEDISKYNVVFFNGNKVGNVPEYWRQLIISYTAGGGAVVLMGHATGMAESWKKVIDYCPPLFPDIFRHGAWTNNHPFSSVSNKYDVFDKNLNWGGAGRYASVKKGKYGEILVVDSKKLPVIIAGAFGKGKVVGIGPVIRSGKQTDSLHKYMQALFIWAGTPWETVPAPPSEIGEYINKAQKKLNATKNDIKNVTDSNKKAFLEKINE